MLKEEEVRLLADELLEPILGPVGFTTSDVESRPDNAGEESLFVKVHFKSGSEVASGRTYIDAQVTLWDALIARGEPRFPYLKYDYPEEDDLKEDESEKGDEP